MNRNCSVCKIKIHKKNCLKVRTVCKSCYNKNRRRNNNNALIQNEFITSNEQPNVLVKNVFNYKNNVNNPCVSTYDNHACVVIGPRNVGKIYYMLKIPEKIGNKRPIQIRTRSPNQYPNYKTPKEIKPIDKYKELIVIFDHMFGARNCSQIEEFSTRRLLEFYMFIKLVRAILVCRGKALEITVIY